MASNTGRIIYYKSEIDHLDGPLACAVVIAFSRWCKASLQQGIEKSIHLPAFGMHYGGDVVYYSPLIRVINYRSSIC